MRHKDNWLDRRVLSEVCLKWQVKFEDMLCLSSGQGGNGLQGRNSVSLNS